MISEGLGRVFNAIAPASGTWINLADAAGVSFLCFEVDGATVLTLSFAADAAGTGAVTPAVIDHYYGLSADVQQGRWHRTSQALSNVVNKADGTEDFVCIEVLSNMCPAGKPWVRLTGDGASTVTAVLHDLNIQRAPQNLRSVTA